MNDITIPGIIVHRIIMLLGVASFLVGGWHWAYYYTQVYERNFSNWKTVLSILIFVIGFYIIMMIPNWSAL